MGKLLSGFDIKMMFFSFLKFIFGHGDIHRKLRWIRIELNDSPSKWG